MGKEEEYAEELKLLRPGAFVEDEDVDRWYPCGVDGPDGARLDPGGAGAGRDGVMEAIL